jgi:hypothetical protein
MVLLDAPILRKWSLMAIPFLLLLDWAMLKPRYPLSECEVPQVNSGSTPSSTSSPHNVGPHGSTRPFPSLPTSNSSTTPPRLSTIESTTKAKRKRFELDFVHLDPVLSVHMRMQSMSMLGRGVIEFIHPEEREREWRRRTGRQIEVCETDSNSFAVNRG